VTAERSVVEPVRLNAISGEKHGDAAVRAGQHTLRHKIRMPLTD
jgi:hypothetical protein